eukprot:gene9347-11479_t
MNSIELLTTTLCHLELAVDVDTIFTSLIKNCKVLKRLEINLKDQFKIEPGWIPDCVKHLQILVNYGTYKSKFQENTLVKGSIPTSVEDLGIELRLYKHDPASIIPSSVKRLKIFGWTSRFNLETNLIPDSVTNLDLTSSATTLRLLSIPPYLTEFRYCDNIDFGSIKPGFFPNSLKVLFIGSRVRLVPHLLPSSVQYLEFSSQYNHAIPIGSIPMGVKSIKLGSTFSHKIQRGVIPSSVQHLQYPDWIVTNQPDGENHIQILPDTITSLEIRYPSLNCQLPSNLEYLECELFTITKNQLPPTLKTLVFDSANNGIEINSIPPSVTSITFAKPLIFTIVAGTLPQNLKELRFLGGGYYPQYIPLPVIPPSVTKLHLSGKWMNKPWLFGDGTPYGSIPQSVEHLELSHDFECNLKKGVLPPNLKTLTINRMNFSLRKTPIHLPNPSGIEMLRIGVCSPPPPPDDCFDLFKDSFSIVSDVIKAQKSNTNRLKHEGFNSEVISKRLESKTGTGTTTISDKDTFDLILKTSHKLLDGTINQYLIQFLKIELSLRTYSPKVEVQRQASEKFRPTSLVSTQGGGDFENGWIEMMIGSNLELIESFKQLDSVLLKFNPEESSASLPTTSYESYEFDHTYPSTSKSVNTLPTFIVYSDITSSSFQKIHQKLSQLSKFGKIRYILRFLVKPEPGKRLHLQGYGFELALKNLEYKVMDDSAIKKEISNQNGNNSETVLSIPNEDVSGINFAILQKRKPELSSKLSTFRSFLLAHNQQAADLKVWETKDLGVQVIQKVVQSPDPLRSLKHIAQKFPTVAGSLARIQVNETLKSQIETNQKAITSSETLLLLNGRLINPATLNPVSLSEIVKSEYESTSQLKDLGISTDTATKMVEIFSSNSIRFRLYPDDESVITYLNNLEQDGQYKKWDATMDALGKSGSDPEAIYMAKNVMTTVSILDFANLDESLLLMNEMQSAIQQLLPTRFSLILSCDQDDISEVRPDAASSCEVIKVFHALNRANGYRSAMFFMQALQYFKKVYTPGADYISRYILQSAFQSVLNQMGSRIRNLNAILQSNEYDTTIDKARQFIKSKKFTQLPLVFVNGVLVDTNSEVPLNERLSTALFEEFETVKRFYKQGLISDSTQSIYKEIMNADNWASEGGLLEFYNPDVIPSPTNPVKYTKLIYNTKDTVKEKRSKEFLDSLVYFQSPRSTSQPSTISYLVVGDFNYPSTIALSIQALDRTDKDLSDNDDKVRVAFISNPVTSEPQSAAGLGEFLSILKHYSKKVDNQALRNLFTIQSTRLAEGKPLLTLQEIIDQLGIPSNDVWVSQYNNLARAAATYCQDLLSTAPTVQQPVSLLTNGRIITPRPGVEFSDFITLETIEMKKATSFLKELQSDEKIKSLGAVSSRFLSDILMKSISLLGHQQTSSDISIRRLPPGIEPSFKHTPQGYETVPLKFTLVINPLTREAQKLVALIQAFADELKIQVDVVLNPPTQLSEMPLKSYYNYIIQLDTRFDSIGQMTHPPSGVMANIPENRVFTMALDTPASWLVTPIIAKYDLDNIRLKDLGQERILSAVFELENIVLEGGCYDVTSHSPPAGLEIVMQPVATHHSVQQDTIVMSNLGYYQLKSNPGIWELKLANGRSSDIMELYDGVPEKPGKIIPSRSVVIDSLYGTTGIQVVGHKAGKEFEPILPPETDKSNDQNANQPPASASSNTIGNIISNLFSGGGAKKTPTTTTTKETSEEETIHIFSVASGHLYERFLKIMMLSVKKNTKSPVKFWFLKNYLSPKFKEFIPKMAEKYDFQYELVTYKWPSWLHKQTEKQRIIWSYKILFLDVLFPLNVNKIIFVDADQVVRTDMKELWDMDLKGASLGYTPFCDSNKDTEGFRFWKSGYWKDHLRGRPYHISALYVVDLKKFRKISAGDQLRSTYNQLSRDANSLANLDQDLPNYLQHYVKIHSLPQEWLWCETWCDQASKTKAKTIDLCNNPLTKTPKLENAIRIISEWTSLDNEAKELEKKIDQENEEKLLLNQKNTSTQPPKQNQPKITTTNNKEHDHHNTQSGNNLIDPDNINDLIEEAQKILI